MESDSKNNGLGKVRTFFRSLYEKLTKIDDSPQKIALGFGLGVFMGIMPGVGPVAALLTAILLRVNRAAALIGGLVTNTWLSLITFVFAVKIGSKVFGLAWEDLSNEFRDMIKNFHWDSLFHSSILKIIVPLLVGYAIVSLTAGIISYFVILSILLQKKGRIKHSVHQ